ncbi:MAG: radical SAM protein, partial [Clostridiales bacterium]|nr:radical SAM protein [Clostridiales bacterium]
SGTVFFGGCSLRCVFCQNYELSRASRGKQVTPKELAEIFRELESMGADNLNLVTPDHVSPLIAEALSLYKPNIPVVYNSSGYCKTEALREIAPFIDIWLPDLKFCTPAIAERYTGRADYFDYASKAIEYMAKKPLVMREDGKMLSGLLVRHLVLPMNVGESKKVLSFLRETLPADSPVSLMRQYTPMGEADKYPELKRRVTDGEYERVLDYALALGFTNLYIQEKTSAETAFIPDWDF